MFTGIIADVAQIVAVAPLGADSSFSGVRVTVQTVHLDLSDVALGDSIAINGACMTVVALDTCYNSNASFSVWRIRSQLLLV